MLLLVLPFLLLPAASIAQTPPIIIDTDAGPDDLMAIAFLLAAPKIRVEAITISVGLAHPESGANNVLRLLELAGRRDIPVYPGRATPLSGNRKFPQEWRRQADELPGVSLPDTRLRPQSRTAAEFLASRLGDPRSPADVVALGGLTNLAETFEMNPQATRAVRRLVIMGGAVRVPGNLGESEARTNTTAEWNFYIDPLAAQGVFTSGAPIRLIPLDATRHIPIDASFADALKRAARTPLSRFVVEILESVRRDVNAGTYFAWDPLAAAALIDPSLVRFERLAISVRQVEPEDGRTVVTRGLRANAEVAMNANPTKFRRLFIGTLASRKE